MSRKAGTDSSETREQILASAQEEFNRYGFQKSSVRRIAGNVGMTTGAIYCFFKGKDELFRSVVDMAIRPLTDYLNSHYEKEMAQLAIDPERDADVDFDLADHIIDLYFRNRKAWNIVLRHQHHPAIQERRDEFIRNSCSHYESMLRATRGLTEEKLQSYSFAIRQFAYMQVGTLTSLIAQDFSRQEMKERSRTSIRMLRGAFDALLEE